MEENGSQWQAYIWLLCWKRSLFVLSTSSLVEIYLKVFRRETYWFPCLNTQFSQSQMFSQSCVIKLKLSVNILLVNWHSKSTTSYTRFFLPTQKVNRSLWIIFVIFIALTATFDLLENRYILLIDHQKSIVLLYFQR